MEATAPTPCLKGGVAWRASRRTNAHHTHLNRNYHFKFGFDSREFFPHQPCECSRLKWPDISMASLVGRHNLNKVTHRLEERGGAIQIGRRQQPLTYARHHHHITQSVMATLGSDRLEQNSSIRR